jgi:hypothetical protein
MEIFQLHLSFLRKLKLNDVRHQLMQNQFEHLVELNCQLNPIVLLHINLD